MTRTIESLILGKTKEERVDIYFSRANPQTLANNIEKGNELTSLS